MVQSSVDPCLAHERDSKYVAVTTYMEDFVHTSGQTLAMDPGGQGQGPSAPVFLLGHRRPGPGPGQEGVEGVSPQATGNQAVGWKPQRLKDQAEHLRAQCFGLGVVVSPSLRFGWKCV